MSSEIIAKQQKLIDALTAQNQRLTWEYQQVVKELKALKAPIIEPRKVFEKNMNPRKIPARDPRDTVEDPAYIMAALSEIVGRPTECTAKRTVECTAKNTVECTAKNTVVCKNNAEKILNEIEKEVVEFGRTKIATSSSRVSFNCTFHDIGGALLDICHTILKNNVASPTVKKMYCDIKELLGYYIESRVYATHKNTLKVEINDLVMRILEICTTVILKK